MAYVRQSVFKFPIRIDLLEHFVKDCDGQFQGVQLMNFNAQLCVTLIFEKPFGLMLQRSLGIGHYGDSVAEWSTRRTRNLVVPGSCPTLTTSWICFKVVSSSTPIGHARK